MVIQGLLYANSLYASLFLESLSLAYNEVHLYTVLDKYWKPIWLLVFISYLCLIWSFTHSFSRSDFRQFFANLFCKVCIEIMYKIIILHACVHFTSTNIKFVKIIDQVCVLYLLCVCLCVCAALLNFECGIIT